MKKLVLPLIIALLMSLFACNPQSQPEVSDAVVTERIQSDVQPSDAPEPQTAVPSPSADISTPSVSEDAIVNETTEPALAPPPTASISASPSEIPAKVPQATALPSEKPAPSPPAATNSPSPAADPAPAVSPVSTPSVKVIDLYNTEAVPEGKPKPVEWQDTQIKDDVPKHCKLTVVCNTILDNMDRLNTDKVDVVPEDGVIYSTQEVEFYEGESVFNVLLREMKKNKIHMEFVMTPIYNSHYIEGINNLYEFDCGELSGWIYKVNGWSPNYGCSRYMLQDGDEIEWVYTCDLGRDVGAGFVG